MVSAPHCSPQMNCRNDETAQPGSAGWSNHHWGFVGSEARVKANGDSVLWRRYTTDSSKRRCNNGHKKQKTRARRAPVTWSPLTSEMTLLVVLGEIVLCLLLQQQAGISAAASNYPCAWIHPQGCWCATPHVSPCLGGAAHPLWGSLKRQPHSVVNFKLYGCRSIQVKHRSSPDAGWLSEHMSTCECQEADD